MYLKANKKLIQRKPLIHSLIVLLVAIIILCCYAPGVASPVHYNGIVSVDTALVLPDNQAVVTVSLSNNDIDFAACTIPLRYNSADLTVDSVSFVGSLMVEGMSGAYYVEAEARIVQISYLPEIPVSNTISSSEGVLARVYFHVSQDAAPGLIPIDSVNDVWQVINFADLSGLSFYLPGFESGAVVVESPTAVEDEINSSLPSAFALNQNYPNPFNPSTVIEFALPRASQVRLEIFNILGQTVALPVNSRYPAGTHRYEFDASALPTGIYFYRLTHDEGSQTRKMMLVK